MTVTEKSIGATAGRRKRLWACRTPVRTTVSALPFVIVILLLCISLYKDLNNDPMLLRHSLANQVLVDSVTTAVTTASEPHEVEDRKSTRLNPQIGRAHV